VGLAALVAIKPGSQPRLIYHAHRGRRGSRRKGVTEADYAAPLDARPPAARRADRGSLGHLNTHVSAAMAAMIAARPWRTVYRLPPYAHELKPVEPVWSHLKRSLANLTKHTITELTALVKTRLTRMQNRPGLLDGFLDSAGTDVSPA